MTTTAIPTAPSELEEMLSDPAKMKNVLGDPESFKTFIKNYATTMVRKDGDITAQVTEQTQQVMANFLREHGYKAEQTPVNLGAKNTGHKVSHGRGAAYNKAGLGARAGADEIFTDSAEFFQAISPSADRLRNARELATKVQKLTEVQNSFGSEVPADGGFLVPESLRSELLMWALESAIVRPRATVIPMSSLRLPIPMIDSTTNVGSVFGGVVAYWTEEAASLTESQASFGRVVLDAKKLTAYAEMPNELLADAIAFGSFFDQIFPQAISFYEDYAFIAGTGAGEPLGYVNSPAVASVSAETGQATQTIQYENLVKMYARMLPTSLSRAVWIASIDTFPQLATMALSIGTGGSAVWLGSNTNPLSAAPPVTILGRPVIFTEKTPALGTTGDISFVDLSYYLIGDRQVMQASSSEHYKFQNDKTAFRITSRVDGRPWLQSPITPKNNSSSTLSAFVQLATR